MGRINFIVAMHRRGNISKNVRNKCIAMIIEDKRRSDRVIEAVDYRTNIVLLDRNVAVATGSLKLLTTEQILCY